MSSRVARYLLAGALAAVCHGAGAQDSSAPAPAVIVQQLAPQLLQFAGSQQNFQNLVTGLAQGTPVQLTTQLPNGFTQTSSFTPTGTLTPLQVAQVLESTRQQLIGLGVGNPTGEQIAAALTGGTVPTALSPALQAQNNPVNVQLSPSAAAGATGLPRVNTSDSPVPSGATSRTPIGSVSATPIPPVTTPTLPASQPTPEPARQTPGIPGARDAIAPRTATR